MSDTDVFEEMVIRKILSELSYYSSANFHDPSVMSLAMKAVMLALVDVQDDNPGFDAKASFPSNPDPTITVSWWIGVQGWVRSFDICLDPLDVRKRGKRDPVEAYDRAMSIL